MIRHLALLLTLATATCAPLPMKGETAQLPMPSFRFDTQWLKMPVNLATGEMVAVAVDKNDHLWVLHRPQTVTGRTPANVAPPIMEFDRDGRYVRGFGGPGSGYEWPGKEHSLAIAANGDIWISGSRLEAEGDDMLLVFDAQGRFVRQIGQRGKSTGNEDRRNVHAAADIFIDDREQAAYVADGYGNQRLVVFGKDDGAFRRMWGAYGKAPPDPRPAPPPADFHADGLEPEYFYGVHGVEKARDGTVYVSDRMHQRIQAFSAHGRYLRQVFINRDAPSPTTASGITFSRDPQQKYMFVADWGNHMIVVVDRRNMSVIGTTGHRGEAAGEFRGPHLIDTDSKGAIYVAEVQGRRVQRLIPSDRPYQERSNECSQPLSGP